MALSFLAGCAPIDHIQALIPSEGIELTGVPFYPQEKYQCGPAALAMVLGASGVQVHPDQLVPQIYIPKRQGSLQFEILAASRKYGRIPYILVPDISNIIAELSAGRPVLVLQNYGLQSLPAYHYAVVYGILPDGRVLLHSGSREREVMHTRQFLTSWNRAGSWGIILLKPGELPAQPDPHNFLNAVNSFETKGYGMEAEKSYLAALTIWPLHTDFLFALGNNYLIRNKLNKAEQLFRKVLSLDPNHIAAANNLAETYVRKNCFNTALIVIAHAVETAEMLDDPLKENVLQTQREILQLHPDMDQSSKKISFSDIQSSSDIQCP